jgi:hypothetical protein
MLIYISSSTTINIYVEKISKTKKTKAIAKESGSSGRIEGVYINMCNFTRVMKI